jgi:hypothetical protein
MCKHGGGDKMRRLTILLTSAVVFTFALLPVISATPNDTLKCELYIELNWDWVGFGGTSPYTWIGTVWGDINGELYITLVDASFSGKTEHFYETWIIVTDDGVIEGYDKGVWRFVNLKWVANGKVTDATGKWSYLVGYNMHYRGVTTEFPVPPGTPVSGTGTLILSSDS